VFGPAGRDHVVLFPASNGELADQVYRHLFGRGEPGTAILVATPDLRQLVADRMAQAGIDVAGEWAAGSLVFLDAAETLDSFMVAGWPDAAAFWHALSPVIKSAQARPGEVRVFGEMVTLLWDAGQTAAAVDVEALFSELARQYSFSLLCSYPADAEAEVEHADDLSHIQGAHSAVLRAHRRR
jgi:hypothetical protein